MAAEKCAVRGICFEAAESDWEGDSMKSNRIPSIVKNAVRVVRPDIAYFEGWDEEEKKHTLERLIK